MTLRLEWPLNCTTEEMCEQNYDSICDVLEQSSIIWGIRNPHVIKFFTLLCYGSGVASLLVALMIW